MQTFRNSIYFYAPRNSILCCFLGGKDILVIHGFVCQIFVDDGFYKYTWDKLCLLLNSRPIRQKSWWAWVHDNRCVSVCMCLKVIRTLVSTQHKKNKSYDVNSGHQLLLRNLMNCIFIGMIWMCSYSFQPVLNTCQDLLSIKELCLICMSCLVSGCLGSGTSIKKHNLATKCLGEAKRTIVEKTNGDTLCDDSYIRARKTSNIFDCPGM